MISSGVDYEIVVGVIHNFLQIVFLLRFLWLAFLRAHS